MVDGRRPPGPVLHGMLATAVPGAAVLFILAVTGILSGAPLLWAVVGLAAGAGAMGLLIGWPLGAVTTYIRVLAQGGDTPAGLPPLPWPPLRALGHSAARLRALNHRDRDQVRRLRQAMAHLLDSLPVPVLLIDGESRVATANQAARDALGAITPGRELATVVRAPALLEAVDALLHDGQSRSVEFSQTGDVPRDWQARLAPLPESMRQEAAGVLLLHDLTAVNRAEQLRADFVANASHELRTPLASIIGFVETLQGPARDDAEAHERFLALMHHEASRMARLVNDLLNLSRIELNEHAAPTDAVALGDILVHVTDLLMIQAREKNIRLVLDCPEALPAIAGDDDELTQVFQNLVDNALKYGPPDSTVTVRVEQRAEGPSALDSTLRRGCLVVHVTDEGEGIPRAHLSRLTERFYRVDPARSRRQGGTGLGLAIVKHVVGRHRGVLAIRSTEGEGSTFSVYLPLRRRR